MNQKEIEDKWKKEWFKNNIFLAKREEGKPKFFIVFAYPNLSGFLHIGHMRGYTYADVIARIMRAKGYNVLFPAGYHCSGLPPIALSRRIERKDAETINSLKYNGARPEDIEKMSDVYFLINYFSKDYIEKWKRMGYTIDFSRQIKTTSPDYSRFIEWQFRKLMEGGYLIQKEHYSSSCLECGPVAIDPSQTDILKGGNAEILDFNILKFPLKNKEKRFLLCATLRPETVFGVTNIWINLEGEYVVAEKNNEEWIISKEAFSKLNYQGFKLKLKEKISPKEILSMTAINFVNKKEIPILEASFVDTNNATGIVMSVPAHAPYDYVALRDLDLLEKIKPAGIIEIAGYSEIPARDVVVETGIKNQKDPRLEGATKKLYKEEFHKGVFRVAPFRGEKVSVVKDLVVEKYPKFFEHMYELSEEVICRCGKKVVVVQVPDQWFIKYSDRELTEKTKQHVKSMFIKPDRYKEELPGVLDWFKDRAAVRKGSWLGTKFPFDREWIIEPIADSTLYPSYYIVSKYFNEGALKTEQMTEDFFDFVFLGKGEISKVSKSTGIPQDLLRKIREDFKYWYPLDINLGGKEHKTVHFPVFLMNHVAILDREKWPKGIFVNWWVVEPTGKISKSKGGAKPLPAILEKYGADTLRLFYCNIASSDLDFFWDENVLMTYKKKIESIYSFAKKIKSLKKTRENKFLDSWLQSKFSKLVKKIEEANKEFNIKELSQAVFFDFLNDFKYYLSKAPNKELSQNTFLDWLKLASVFIPFTCEEIWHNFGNKDFISLEELPKLDKTKINEETEAKEDYYKTLLEDFDEILKLANINKEDKKRVYVFTSPNWKIDLLKILEKNKGDYNATIKEAFTVEEIKKKGKEPAKILRKFVEKSTWKERGFDEEEFLKQQKQRLEEDFRAEVLINKEREKEEGKALPLKPEIKVEKI